MAYLVPSEFVTKMVDAGEAKVFMSTRDTVIRAYMAGAILALAAVFAVSVTVQTGYPIIGAMLFGTTLALLSGFPVPDLAAAVRSGDVKRLSTIPGVGKKTAERIVLELRDKFGSLEVPGMPGVFVAPGRDGSGRRRRQGP